MIGPWIRAADRALIGLENRPGRDRIGGSLSHIGAAVIAAFLMAVSLDDDRLSGSRFAVTAIEIEGLHHMRASDLLPSMGVGVGDSLFAVSVRDIRHRLLDLGWVEAATVRRDWSGRIHLRIRERKPYAVWRSAAGEFLIDRSGASIEENPSPRFADLPLIAGKGALSQAPAIIDMIQGRPLPGYAIDSLFFVSSRRWDVHLRGDEGDFVLRLPEGKVEAAWNRFRAAQEKHGFLHSRIRSVDLRVPGRLVVGLEEIVPKNPDVPSPESSREHRRL